MCCGAMFEDGGRRLVCVAVCSTPESGERVGEREGDSEVATAKCSLRPGSSFLRVFPPVGSFDGGSFNGGG